jgi:integrase
MFLHKRKSTGFWYVYYRDESGKQRIVSTRQRIKSDALKFLKNFTSTDREKHKPSVSLSDFIPEYLAYSKTIHTPNSHASARSALNEFIRIVGDKSISNVTVRDVENFTAKKRERSVHTARKNFVTVAAAFRKAVDWQYIPFNPFSKANKPKLPDLQPAYFTHAEFAQFTNAIDNPEFLDFVTVGILTGLRLSELINLKWGCIDFERGLVHVINTAEFTTKSKRNRSVPMNDKVCEIFRRRISERVSEYCFHRRSRKLNRYFVSKKFKDYVRASGVNPKLHFHSLRHTFVTWLVSENVNIFDVQHFAGHSSVTVTQGYAHFQPGSESHRQSINKLKLDGGGNENTTGNNSRVANF